jgi:hypothetical protein
MYCSGIWMQEMSYYHIGFVYFGEKYRHVIFFCQTVSFFVFKFVFFYDHVSSGQFCSEEFKNLKGIKMLAS